MTTWTGISDYAPSLDFPLNLEGKPPFLVERLMGFQQAHELCLLALGDRERGIAERSRKRLIENHRLLDQSKNESGHPDHE